MRRADPPHKGEGKRRVLRDLRSYNPRRKMRKSMAI
jgi:hypothetical protein